MQNPQEHWEEVYQTKPSDAVSWFQVHATRSLEIIRSIGAGKSSRVIDVGGGGSTLVYDLLQDGFEEITVLDFSNKAFHIARTRLGKAGKSVSWITGDVLNVPLPAQAYDIWHDRAVFHFLTDPADRLAYVRQVMSHCLKPH